MTDDLEPRLAAHLRQRAGRVASRPDVADLRQRIDARGRRTTRGLGAALALALVAGPVAGWAAARSIGPERDTVTASGGAGGGGSAVADELADEASFEGGGAAYLDPVMELVSTRTTAEGIRLVVRSTMFGDSGGDPCAVDGLVRVGIVDGDLIDVAPFETSPGGASFGIAGGADGRPMWVVLARAESVVEARFPNGATDRAEAANGVAVLAAYAGDGQPAEDLVADTVEVTGPPDHPPGDGPRAVTIDRAAAGCPTEDPSVEVPLELAMPEPGEPPADEDAARAAINDLWLAAFDGAGDPTEANLRERPEVWLDAAERFKREQPAYAAMASHVSAVVHEIVFTAPDRASVHFSLVSDDPSVPAPGEWLGEAVLIDGTWKVSIDISCRLLALAGIDCDHSL